MSLAIVGAFKAAFPIDLTDRRKRNAAHINVSGLLNILALKGASVVDHLTEQNQLLCGVQRIRIFKRTVAAVENCCFFVFRVLSLDPELQHIGSRLIDAYKGVVIGIDIIIQELTHFARAGNSAVAEDTLVGIIHICAHIVHQNCFGRVFRQNVNVCLNRAVR